MKKNTIFMFSIIFLILFGFLIGCQSKEAVQVEESTKEGQDYNKLFELELYSDKQVYKITDKIQIWATLKYVGSKNQIAIWHGDPSINFYITDGKAFNTGGAISSILASTTLERDKLYRFNYAKSGGYANDDLNADFWNKFYSEKDLILPEGEYEVKVVGVFSISKEDRSNSGISDKINIKVEK